MADETAVPAPPQPPEYPPFNFPTVFADGALSAVWGTEFIKFYLGRNDPDFKAASTVRQQTPFVLVAMPLSGFVQTVTFFDSILTQMIRDGYTSEEAVAAARKKHEDREKQQ